MGELLVQFLTANDADAAVLRAETSRKTLLADVAGEEKRIADVPGDYSVRAIRSACTTCSSDATTMRAHSSSRRWSFRPITPSRTTTSG